MNQPQSGTLRAATLIVILVWALLCTSCGNNGTSPERVEHYLYVGVSAHYPAEPKGHVDIVDCESDSVIARIEGGFGDEVDVVASPNGKYVVTLSATTYPVTSIWDATSRLLLVNLPTTRGGVPEFITCTDLLVKPERDHTAFFRVPGGELILESSFELGEVRHIPNTHLLIGKDHRYSDEYGPDDSKLTLFDRDTMEPTDSIIIQPDEHGIGVQIARFDVSSDGRWLYALCAGKNITQSFLRYDLSARQLQYIKPLPLRDALGYCRVAPGGSEVWVSFTASGLLPTPAWPTAVFVFDAASGIVTDSISLRALRPGSTVPLIARDIRFLPDGSKAYISGGTNTAPSLGRQPLLVVDAQSKEVIDLIYPDFDHLAMFIDIGPKP